MTQAPLDPATAPAGTTSLGGETHERDWAELELEALHDLARIGNSISEQLNQGYKATAAALPAGSPARVKADREVALAFMRLSRAVRVTMAMFGRVRQAREALAAGTASPAGPATPPTGASQRAVEAMVRALEATTLDLDAGGDDFDDDDLDDEEDLFDDLYDGPDTADRSDRPDRESLTELADFGFSLDHCRPGEVIAGIYRDLGLPPDPARWPQALPDGVPTSAAGRPAPSLPSETDRSQSTALPRPAARGEVGNPLGFPGEGPAPADGKSPHPVSLREPDLSRKRERQHELRPLSPNPLPPEEDSS